MISNETIGGEPAGDEASADERAGGAGPDYTPYIPIIEELAARAKTPNDIVGNLHDVDDDRVAELFLYYHDADVAYYQIWQLEEQTPILLKKDVLTQLAGDAPNAGVGMIDHLGQRYICAYSLEKLGVGETYAMRESFQLYTYTNAEITLADHYIFSYTHSVLLDDFDPEYLAEARFAHNQESLSAEEFKAIRQHLLSSMAVLVQTPYEPSPGYEAPIGLNVADLLALIMGKI